MYLKQATTGLSIMLLCAVTSATAAPAKDQGPAEKATANGGAQIIIRSEAEKKRRQQEEARPPNQNSNRQSEDDSNRGLERAEERRPAQAGKQSEEAWYENIFGQRNKPHDKPDKQNDESRWWWPFD